MWFKIKIPQRFAHYKVYDFFWRFYYTYLQGSETLRNINFDFESEFELFPKIFLIKSYESQENL